MDELQRMFVIVGEDKDYYGLMRLFRTFEGMYHMDAQIDVTEDADGSRKVLKHRNDQLPRLQPEDLKPYQDGLIFNCMETMREEDLSEVPVFGSTVMIDWKDLLDFNEVLKKREAEEAAAIEIKRRKQNG